MDIIYAPKFKKLEKDLQDEIIEKIALFRNIKNHKHLKVHKLGGNMKGRYSFYVNYKIRVVFKYIAKMMRHF